MRVISEGMKSYPLTCSQCLAAPCEAICGRDAIYRHRDQGYLKVDRWGCNQCGLCVAACPFGMIRMGLESVVKCELCGGDPECVKICPTGALRLFRRYETNLDED